jgi:hypothetical protein
MRLRINLKTELTYDAINSLLGLNLMRYLRLVVDLIPDSLHGSNAVTIGNIPRIMVASDIAYKGWHKGAAPAIGVLTPIGKMRVIKLHSDTANMVSL